LGKRARRVGNKPQRAAGDGWGSSIRVCDATRRR
jgi:hypothetical protein